MYCMSSQISSTKNLTTLTDLYKMNEVIFHLFTSFFAKIFNSIYPDIHIIYQI